MPWFLRIRHTAAFVIWASCNYKTTSAAELQMIINSRSSRFALYWWMKHRFSVIKLDKFKETGKFEAEWNEKLKTKNSNRWVSKLAVFDCRFHVQDLQSAQNEGNCICGVSKSQKFPGGACPRTPLVDMTLCGMLCVHSMHKNTQPLYLFTIRRLLLTLMTTLTK